VPHEFPSQVSGPGAQFEEPTASAHLIISLTKIDSSVTVPAKQARDLIRVFASLTGLTIMAVICPAVTLNEASHVLAPGWTAFFLTFELTAAIIVALWPYRSRT
jgi:hypothetical protein